MVLNSITLERVFSPLLSWWLRKRQERRDALLFERKVIVRLDDSGISASYPTGESQTVSWPEIQRVAIETNDSGPWGADFWWLLEGETKRCTFPQGATGEIAAVEAFPARFPGFSHEAVTKANHCTSNARFLCWERSSAL